MKNPEHEGAGADELDLEEWTAKHPSERPPRCSRYRIRVDRNRFVVHDSAKTGAEILALAGYAPDERDGTGSYVLDLVAKTPVREIRLFDPDEYLQHNAFRSPGAPSLKRLREAPLKVDYFKALYEQMHRGVVAHAVALDATNVTLLEGITFAFLCLDSAGARRPIVENSKR